MANMQESRGNYGSKLCFSNSTRKMWAELSRPVMASSSTTTTLDFHNVATIHPPHHTSAILSKSATGTLVTSNASISRADVKHSRNSASSSNETTEQVKHTRQRTSNNAYREVDTTHNGPKEVIHRSSSKDMPADERDPIGVMNYQQSITPHPHELVINNSKSLSNRSANLMSNNGLLTSTIPALTQPQSSASQHTTPYSIENGQPSRPYYNDTDSHAIKLAADCLHAQDYSRMIIVLSNESVTIAVLFGRGLANYKLRKFQEAIKNFMEMDELTALSLSENHGNVYLAHYYLGEIDYAHNRYRKAAEHYYRASMAYSVDTVAKKYRIVQPTLATVFSKQGSALRQAQLIMEAVKAYKDALSAASTKKDRLAVYTSLGNLYQSLGENSSALIQYEQTITLATELNDFVSLGWAHGNIGNAHLSLYQKEKALKHLEQALELTIKHEPSPQAIGRAYNNLGTAYQSLNELEKAEEYYDLALSQAIYGMDLGGQARVYGNYGNLLMLQKKFERAIVHYSEALSITADRSTRSTAHHNRGCAHYEKAETTKKRMQAVAKPNDDNPFEVVYSNTQEPVLIDSVKKGYENGRDDLIEVVKYHEETFQTIKGSSHGLNLSVSLFETNSRTFHRLQDCLYNLGKWDSALEFAEQSRARTLGELLMQRKRGQLSMELTSPLNIDQIMSIVTTANTIVVFMSYTGARLLTWVFIPYEGKIVTRTFQVKVEDDQFDGKSLDYFLRYSLSEQLIDNNVEMYSHCVYDKSPPLTKLFQLFGKPLLMMLDSLSEYQDTVKDVILIPDSYTNLIPVVAILNSASHQFMGDRFCFRIMPSLLTLGILNQLPSIVVKLPEESQNFCVVGNPTIPTFKYLGETWNLGKLPFATLEAETVAHILKCTPTLHEQATKMVVLSMILQAKVIHLATHGSASAGFLAFAGLGSSRSRTVSDDKLVLLYPEDIEKLNINPALVVLSSCDSGRGTVKADGIQGMARAFILAGAQAVLTTLWRVPDESAAVFMQFFYQYMMDGFKGSHALRKAIMSVRSFKKYSRYIHWSGYQLTGREIEFDVAETRGSEVIQKKMGSFSVFPQLEVIKSLEKALIKDSYCPTDVQVIHGPHGLKPSEPVIEFVANNYKHFTGGVFYVSAENEHFLTGAREIIIKEMRKASAQSCIESPLLLILDNLVSLPPEDSFLFNILRKSNTHVILILNKNVTLEGIRKEIDNKLVRGTNIIELKPLSVLHSTQRIVHGIVSKCDFVPYNREQDIIADIAERTMGSSDLIQVASSLLSKYSNNECGDVMFLNKFSSEVCCETVDQSDEKNYCEFASQLLDNFNLSKSDSFLLSTLSLFGTAPVPRCLVEMIQNIAIAASSDPSRELSPMANLIEAGLLNVFPSPVILPPGQHQLPSNSFLTVSEFYYVPQLINDVVQHFMDVKEFLFTVTAVYRSLNKFYTEYAQKDTNRHLTPFMAGLSKILVDRFENHEKDMETCYREIYRIYLLLDDGHV